MCLSLEDKQYGHVWSLRSVTPITERKHCTRKKKKSPQPVPRFLINLVKYTDLQLGATSDNKNGMTYKMIRKELGGELCLFFLHSLCARRLGSRWGLAVLGKNRSHLQAAPSLPLPTADSITQSLLLSMVLMLTLPHMTRVMSPARDDRGPQGEKKKKNLHKTYFIQNLNVKWDLPLRAQLLPGCEQLHSISPDLGR